MKNILIGVVLFSTFCAHAAEKRSYIKINSSEAQVTIETNLQETVQASQYVDGKENAQFVKDLLSDNKSLLSKIVSTIEIENCKNKYSSFNQSIVDCGAITITNEVLTSFGRDGWMSSGGSYTFFVGFTSEGSGRYFEVSHMVVISENVEAQIKKDGNYSGVIIKTLNLVGIKRIDDLTPLY
jgi:hypothetical protein